MHPGNDTFVTTGEDGHAYLWNVSTPQWVGRLDLPRPTLSAWDPSGRVFAVAMPNSSVIFLFDNRSFDRGPFNEIDVLRQTRAFAPKPSAGDSAGPPIPNCANTGWTKLEFSNDGKSILLGTRGACHYMLDAFDGHLRATLARDPRAHGLPSRLAPGDDPDPDPTPVQSEPALPPGSRFEGGGDVAFSPDGRFVVGGSRRGILVWDTLSYVPVDKRLEPSYVLEDSREAAVLSFNPRFNFIATADEDLVFWMPDMYQ